MFKYSVNINCGCGIYESMFSIDELIACPA